MASLASKTLYRFGAGSWLEQTFCENRVSDWELLYRSIRKSEIAPVDSERGFRVSSAAFNDVNRRPSVDRALLRSSAQVSKRGATDAIAGLISAHVRLIQVDQPIPSDTPKDAPKKQYLIDVKPRPIFDPHPERNLAHSQVESNPAFDSDSRFKKLKEKLARLAEQRPLEIEPGG